MMRRLVLAFAMALGMAGCSQTDRAKLINETGAPIVLRLTAATPDGRDAGHDVLLTIKAGKSTTFDGWRLRRDRLSLTAGSCRYDYDVDSRVLWRLRKEAERTFPIEIRLRRDFMLDLPPGTYRAARHRPADFGFPRGPKRKMCG